MERERDHIWYICSYLIGVNLNYLFNILWTPQNIKNPKIGQIFDNYFLGSFEKVSNQFRG